MKKIKIVFAFWSYGARSILPTREIENNLLAFKREVREILNSEKDKDGVIPFMGEKYNRRSKVSIGRYNPMGEEIKDWNPLSKLPTDFLDGHEYYDFCISIN